MTAVACGLTISFCAGALWVERHSVPVACLSLPCVAWFWNVGLLLFDSVPCFAIPAIRCTRDNWIFLDDSYKWWVTDYSSWISWPIGYFNLGARVLYYSSLGDIHLWLGWSRVECSALLHSFLSMFWRLLCYSIHNFSILFIYPLLVRLP